MLKMRIIVEAKPGARRERIERVADTLYRVWVRERPEDGAANAAVEKVLADFLDIAPARIRIVSGKRSRKKIVEIL